MALVGPRLAQVPSRGGAGRGEGQAEGLAALPSSQESSMNSAFSAYAPNPTTYVRRSPFPWIRKSSSIAASVRARFL